MTGPETIKRLGSRFPCCDRASTHKLELDVPRQLRCEGCGITWAVTLIECDPRVQVMAGQRVAKCEWSVIEGRRSKADAPTA